MTVEICIASRTGLVEPKGEVTQPYIDLFLQDNKHVTGEILHNGTAYLNRQGASNNSNIKIPVKTRQLMEELQALPPIHRQALGQVNQTVGSTLTFALAAFYEAEISPIVAEANQFNNAKVMPLVKNESLGVTGAGFTALGKRNSEFLKHIALYKNSLEDLRIGYLDKVPKAKQILLQNNANRIHQELNRTFNQELNKHMPKAGKRGSVWSSATRGAGLARGARSDAPINLTNTQEVAKLKRLGQGMTLIGNTLVALDAGLRVSKVLEEKERGKEWEKTMVKEAAGFGLGTAFGIGAADAVIVAAANIFLASTPAGWIILIGLGVTAGYAASKAGDGIGQYVAGKAYETSSNIRWFD